jgi:hypothetical protein
LAALELQRFLLLELSPSNDSLDPLSYFSDALSLWLFSSEKRITPTPQSITFAP